MPKGVRGARYLVFAREDFSSYIEGRAFSKAGTKPICRFILKDVINRYGCFCQVGADHKELNSQQVKDFFKKHKIDLKLTTTYNPIANGWGVDMHL